MRTVPLPQPGALLTSPGTVAPTERVQIAGVMTAEPTIASPSAMCHAAVNRARRATLRTRGGLPPVVAVHLVVLADDASDRSTMSKLLPMASP